MSESFTSYQQCEVVALSGVADRVKCNSRSTSSVATVRLVVVIFAYFCVVSYRERDYYSLSLEL